MHDRRQFPLRVAERGKQPLDAAKRQIDRLRMQLLQALEQRVGAEGKWRAALVALRQVGQGGEPLGVVRGMGMDAVVEL